MIVLSEAETTGRSEAHNDHRGLGLSMCDKVPAVMSLRHLISETGILFSSLHRDQEPHRDVLVTIIISLHNVRFKAMAFQ